MQTSVSADRAQAVPGLLSDDAQNYIVGEYTSAEALTPGKAVVLNSDGKLEHPQDTTITKIVGFVCFSPSNQQEAIPGAGFTYPAGVQVPVLRRGRIFATVVSSSEPTPLDACKIHHSSTIATNRGAVTTNAADTDAGEEVTAGAGLVFVRKATTALWLVEANYPT